MSTTTSGEVATGVDLAAVLLESKLAVPSLPPGSVSRRAVIGRAARSDARVIAVSAPAGFGKTTLLAEWAQLEEREIAWVSLDAGDDDPTALLTLLASACAAFSPLAESAIAQMRGVGVAPLARAAPLLSAVLAASPEPFVLFVDDLHFADSPGCQDVLEVAVAGVPAGSQVILASRRETPLIARMRTAGVAAEVAASDLSLASDDARALFARVGASIADDELDSIVAKSEGWPAGLFLCAQIVRADGDTAGISGDHRYLADYLYRECIARLPPDVQRFLRRTAVLTKFSADACVDVADEDRAREMIHEIDTANLFLIPLDRERGWYRYHALFREYLLAELEREEGAAAVQALHRRAAAWLGDQGLAEAAVEHLLLAGDLDRAAVVTADVALSLYDRGRMLTIRRWLGAIGPDEIRRHPPAAVIAGWAGALSGDIAEGERWAHVLEGIETDHACAGEEGADVAAARAMLRAAMCRYGAKRALDDALCGVSRQPLWSPWRAVAQHLVGSAQLLVGDEDAARDAFLDAVDLSEATGIVDPAILSEPELALLAMRANRVADARAHAERGVALVESSTMIGYPVTGLALAVGARMALRDERPDRARQRLARAMRARVDSTYLLPFLSVRTRLQLAKAHASMGDHAAARHLIHEIDDVFAKRPDLGTLVEQVEAFRRSLDGDAFAGGATPLTPAELRLLPYLQTYLTIGEIGERLFVSRNTVSSEVSSIYRKLGVTSRGGAVDRATELGMLGD
ncbi:AAA family ATPase [Microbacterium awajiense]|uniref:AAA family ATPase n=1 Tax=Microbacterium awajiense TaxID=415214 RepID=UPI0031D2A27C